MRPLIKQRLDAIAHGEVPEGYSSERDYIVPSGWRLCKFTEVFSRLTRKNSEDNQNVLTISAQMGLVNQKDYYIHSVASEDKQKYYLLRRGDFAYNKSSAGGYPYGAIKRLDLYESGVISPLYICFSMRNKRNSSDFFLQYFEGGLYNKEIYKIAQEGARNHGLLNVEIDGFFGGYLLLPPLPEQQKIASILARCDTVIELKQELIGELRRRKKWLMQMLLNPDSGVRLPGFYQAWEDVQLSKLGEFSKGKGISNEDCENGDIPCIKYGDIYVHFKTFFDKTMSFTHQTVANESVKFGTGILLFTGSGEDPLEIGKCVAYVGDSCIAVGGDIIVMKPHNGHNPVFLSYQLGAWDLIKQKAAMAQGQSIVHIYVEQIKKLRVKIPPSPEQAAIADLLSATDNEISLHEQELNEWQKKKKSLMQLLLTGIVRVSDFRERR